MFQRNIPPFYPRPKLKDFGLAPFYMAVIQWLKTPSGRISRHYQYTIVYRNEENFHLRESQAFMKAKKVTEEAISRNFAGELRNGYTLDRVRIYRNNWNNLKTLK